MGLPYENEPDPETEEEQPAPPDNVVPFPPRQKPDWLTDASDDIRSAAELEKAPPAEPAAMPQPVLTRPSAPRPQPTGEIPPVPAGPEVVAEPAATADAVVPPAASRPAAWTAAASSIPIPKLALPPEPEKLGDDATDDAPGLGLGLPGGKEDQKVTSAPPAIEPLREPWWLIALDALRSDRRVQIGVAAGVACLGILAYCLWPQGVDATPLSRIRRHPAEYDGRAVVVRGRVGDDVFAVGSGWAYFLTQGRDTIVAFTRTHAPRPHESVTVKGQVSTGFLDGIPRQALFEDPAEKK